MSEYLEDESPTLPQFAGQTRSNFEYVREQDNHQEEATPWSSTIAAFPPENHEHLQLKQMNTLRLNPAVSNDPQQKIDVGEGGASGGVGGAQYSPNSRGNSTETENNGDMSPPMDISLGVQGSAMFGNGGANMDYDYQSAASRIMQ